MGEVTLLKSHLPKLRTTIVKIDNAEQFQTAPQNPLADCLWVGFVPAPDLMERAHKLGKQVWLRLKIGEGLTLS